MNKLQALPSVTMFAVLAMLSACGAGEPAPAADANEGMAASETPARAAADNVIPTDSGDLIVQPIHHGSLMLAWNGTNILIDPAPAPGSDSQDPVAEYTAMDAPNLILVTDIHGDHMNADILAAVSANATVVAPQAVADQLPEAVRSKTQVLANGETTTVAGVAIEAVPMYNISPDRLQYHEKGRGNGYVLTMGGKRIYVAGDTEDIPEMRALQNIDAAFLPMNLPYTMTPEQSADAVREFRPAVVFRRSAWKP